MKKSIFTIAALAAIMAVSSCKSENKTETATTPETAATEVKALTPAEKNLQAGQEYLDSLKANDKDVKFTESGLGYRVVKEGKGETPAPTSTVNVKYTGKHINGEVFDSSGDNVVPFPLSGVIPGFSEGIGMMNKGAVYELYIPANLGYGTRGASPVIGPNETLIFEVEVVDF